LRCPDAALCNVWDAHMGSVIPMTTTAVPFCYNCNVWDAHMGSVIPMTTTAIPFCYNWFRILKLVALTLPEIVRHRLGRTPYGKDLTALDCN